MSERSVQEATQIFRPILPNFILCHLTKPLLRQITCLNDQIVMNSRDLQNSVILQGGVEKNYNKHNVLLMQH
jgi:hypothetical protein